MRHALRLLMWVAGAMVGVALLYFGGVNAVLATDWPREWLNADPEHVRVGYRRAWTQWPLSLHVEGLTISIQDPDTQVQVQVERLAGRISPWALRQLRLQADDVAASGIIFRMRERLAPGDTTVDRTWLPDIEGYPSPERVLNDVWPTLITIDLRRARLTQVQEVWVGEVRYRGNGALSGDLSFEPLRSLALRGVAITDTQALLTRGPSTVATVESIAVKVDLERTLFRELGPLDFSKLTTTLALRGELDSAYLLNYALRGAPAFHTSGGDGPVSANVHLIKGVLQEGSTFTSSAPELALHTRFLSLSGQATVKATVGNGVRRLELGLNQPRLTSPEHEPWMRAQRFQLHSKGPVDLAAPDVFDATLSLTQAHADDVRFVNRFIPRATGLAIVSGKGLLNATLALNSVTSRGEGALELNIEDLEVRNRVSRLLGRAEVKATIVSLDLKTGALRLDGSSIAIHQARIFADNKEYTNFWASLTAPECLLTPAGDVKWSTRLALTLQHLQPVLGMVAAQVPIPFPLRLMAEHPDVSASVLVTVREDEVELADLRVHASALDIWGDLRLLEKDQGVWGAVLVKSPPVTAGLDLRGPLVTPILADGEPWFRKWKAARPGAPARNDGARRHLD